MSNDSVISHLFAAAQKQMFPQRDADEPGSTAVTGLDRVLILLCKSTEIRAKVKVAGSLCKQRTRVPSPSDLVPSDSLSQVLPELLKNLIQGHTSPGLAGS